MSVDALKGHLDKFMVRKWGLKYAGAFFPNKPQIEKILGERRSGKRIR
jgi:hypothetical protein